MESSSSILTWSALISLLISALVTLIVHKLLVKDVKKLVEDLEFLKLQYQNSLQAVKYELENRRKTEIVAELFALWSQSFKTMPSGVPNRLYRAFLPDDFKKLQQLSFECSLWLPPEIMKELSKRLLNAADAKDLKEILVMVRSYLNPNLGAIDASIIIHW